MSKPSIPQGTRDFHGEVLRRRIFILDTIKSVFRLYGFEPLETPALENLETLMGKYGEEGDKLIFKILNNGLGEPKNENKSREGFEKALGGKSTSDLTSRALKYDLTIPFARFVAMNHHELTMPYKRYQVQPVWRADRPQKGRYREFTQCDADIVGSTSLLNEIDLVHIYHNAFTRLGITGYTLHINDRRILSGLATLCEKEGSMPLLAGAIDKLDKTSLQQVQEDLSSKGFNEKQVHTVSTFLSIKGSNREILDALKSLFHQNETALQGIDSLETILANTPGSNLRIDGTLARGLDYYTGTIFEAKAPAHVNIGSIGGGGRYDNLTGLFGVSGIAGVGISFGVDRIYDVMAELELFNMVQSGEASVLFLNMGKKESLDLLPVLNDLRSNGVACELYPEAVKMDKQIKYALKKNARYVVIRGTREIENDSFTVKNLVTSTQEEISSGKLAAHFTKSV